MIFVLGFLCGCLFLLLFRSVLPLVSSFYLTLQEDPVREGGGELRLNLNILAFNLTLNSPLDRGRPLTARLQG